MEIKMLMDVEVAPGFHWKTGTAHFLRNSKRSESGVYFDISDEVWGFLIDGEFENIP